MLTAGAILVALLVFGGLRYDHFASLANVFNLLGDYSYVGIAGVGATFVVLSGGIDLSVGSMIAFTAVLMADLVARGWHPLSAALVCLVACTFMGAAMGWLICFFALPAFMVTLAGMFAIRAACFLVREQSVGIDHPFFAWTARHLELDLGGGAVLPMRSLLLLATVAAGVVVARSTGFGRNVYAIGGHERSARMMGVPVVATRIRVHALAGLCSSLAGLVFTMYKQSGDPTSAVGLELSVIASVVIGGTLLSGGVGSVQGTLLGVLILGVIRLLIDFQGNVNAAWTSISIGLLLLVFICLQRLIVSIGNRASQQVLPARKP